MPQKMDLWYSRLAQILLRDPRRLGDFAISFLMISTSVAVYFKLALDKSGSALTTTELVSGFLVAKTTPACQISAF